jgi:hypothetical protein
VPGPPAAPGLEVRQDNSARCLVEALVRNLTIPEILGLQAVQRWHTVATLHTQTVADHSCVVALLALRIGGEDLAPQDQVQVLLLGLQHDAHEARFGDLPYPAKQALRVLGLDIDGICSTEFWGADGPDATAPLVQDLVAVADRLEAALFARRGSPEIARSIAEGAQALALERLRDERRWGMRARALEILKEVL